MKIEDKFLAAYKDYETAVRDMGIDPRDYEEGRDELTKGRLGACRFLRNYISHKNDAGFLVPTEKQIEFLRQEEEKLLHGQDILKKHIKSLSQAACTPKDKCRDVLNKLAKIRPSKVIVDTPDGIKLADMYEVALKAAESKTAKMSDVKLSDKGFTVAGIMEKMETLPSDSIIVAFSGNNVAGVYYPS